MSIFCLRSRSEQFFVHTNLFTLPTKKAQFWQNRQTNLSYEQYVLLPETKRNRRKTEPRRHTAWRALRKWSKKKSDKISRIKLKWQALPAIGSYFSMLLIFFGLCFVRCVLFFFLSLESNWLLQWFGCFLSHVRTIWDARKFDICQLVLRTHTLEWHTKRHSNVWCYLCWHGIASGTLVKQQSRIASISKNDRK